MSVRWKVVRNATDATVTLHGAFAPVPSVAPDGLVVADSLNFTVDRGLTFGNLVAVGVGVDATLDAVAAELNLVDAVADPSSEAASVLVRAEEDRAKAVEQGLAARIAALEAWRVWVDEQLEALFVFPAGDLFPSDSLFPSGDLYPVS